MKRQLLLMLMVLATVTTYGQRVIRVKKNDARSLLAAIEQANRQNADSATAERTVILVPSGYYNLGETVLTTITGHRVSLVGEGMLTTIIRNAPDVAIEGIGKTAVIRNLGTDNYFQDLTLRNDLDYYRAGAAGRAVCLQDRGTRTICNRVRMLSYQDTYYSDNVHCQHYFADSEIHGTVDFICGAGDVWFERCRIVTEKRTADGSGRCVIAAPRTAGTPWGYVFNGCTVENVVSEFDYARGWHTQPRCTWLHTTLLTPEKLGPTRFDHRGMRTVQNDFKEYGTMDATGKDITPATNVVTFTLNDERNAVETILTRQQAKRFTVKRAFPDWRPDRVARQLERQAARLRRTNE